MFHFRISRALGKCYQEVKHFYSNEEKLRLYYYVSNFAINQPMLPVISDPGSEHPDSIPLP